MVSTSMIFPMISKSIAVKSNTLGGRRAKNLSLLTLASRISGRNHMPLLHRQVQILIGGFPEDSPLHHLVGSLLTPVYDLGRIGIELVRNTVVVSADELYRCSFGHAHWLDKRVHALPVEVVARDFERGLDPAIRIGEPHHVRLSAKMHVNVEKTNHSVGVESLFRNQRIVWLAWGNLDVFAIAEQHSQV